MFRQDEGNAYENIPEDNSEDELEPRGKPRLFRKKLTYTSCRKSPQVLVRDGNSVAYEARIAGHRRVKQVTKWQSLNLESVRNFLEVNPGFTEKQKMK